MHYRLLFSFIETCLHIILSYIYLYTFTYLSIEILIMKIGIVKIVKIVVKFDIIYIYKGINLHKMKTQSY